VDPRFLENKFLGVFRTGVSRLITRISSPALPGPGPSLPEMQASPDGEFQPRAVILPLKLTHMLLGPRLPPALLSLGDGPVRSVPGFAKHGDQAGIPC